MNKEFIFGKTVTGDNFVGRADDIRRLGENFKSGINTILSSPRRWGKTSLVKRVKEEMQSDTLRIVYIDIFACRDEYEFYNLFAEGVLRVCSSKFDEWRQIASSFLSRLSPVLTFSPDPLQEYSVSLGISPKTHTPEEVLNLPEQIAQKRNIEIVVCIDEFQQIGEFQDSSTFLRRLRTVWQHHEHTSYCLFGSKKYLMDDLFLHKNQAFYKFGSHFHLQLIETLPWVEYICRQFERSGKHCSVEYAAAIVSAVDNHSYYVQQLAWITFTQTVSEVNQSILDGAIQTLLDENSAYFTQQVESLSSYQLHFLRAILDGVHDSYGVSAVKERYNLGSNSNINRLKTAMLNKEIVTQRSGGYYICDPVLKLWLKRIF